MEIYILRDGKEIGPFSEETTQSLLKEGAVLISDLACRPGMAQWIPLHSVLYPIPGQTTAPPPPPPPPSDASGATVDRDVSPVSAKEEPATPKQKAFLAYMGLPVSDTLSKEAAALLVNDALENPRDAGKLTRWNNERLRLHPELFEAEIKAKKENRANHFFEVSQGEGAQVLEGVTKAHCQVLVGFLDVHHPHWDAYEHQATWDYFFPAVAEKFPQLVKRDWRGKLKYPAGPKVAPELTRKRPVAIPARSKFPAAAIVRGIVLGVTILALLYGGYLVMTKKRSTRDSTAHTKSVEKGAEAKKSSEGEGSTAELEKLMTQLPPVSGGATANAGETASTTNDSSSTGSSPRTTPAPMTNATTASSTLENPASSAPTERANASTPNSNAPPAPAFEPLVAQPRATLTITKPTEILLRFGRVKLPAGTIVKFVAQEGNFVRVRYGTDIVTVPVTSTDLTDFGATPPPPAPPIGTPPTATAPPIVPLPAPPATPSPASPPTSLF